MKLKNFLNEEKNEFDTIKEIFILIKKLRIQIGSKEGKYIKKAHNALNSAEDYISNVETWLE